ncbi:hypothetical protein [uncultured Kiloniella sp.]|uniref:hypothetical protein n=1 Tax=uncultured Kiloniella sp. TaxID=1133091 RepID=UPI00262262CE|nr:hypothetical protein [uncultured Kiloniella sp.]
MNQRDLLAIDKALAAWGADIPDWVTELAKASDSSSMSAVSRQLGLSTTVISQGVNNKYGLDGKGNINTLKEAVETHLMSAEILCPAFQGSLLRTVCEEWQASAKNAVGSNPARHMMAQQCRKCPHSKIKGDS